MSGSTPYLAINKKTAAKAVLLPGILPRLKDLFGSPFIFLAYGYAHLFQLVRLLPMNHTYLQRQNFGKFGVFDVMVAASANVEFSLKHIDRVLAYFSVIASFVIILLFGITALLFVFMGQAWAQLAAMLQTPAPADDIALMMLDATFGIPGIYNSSMMTATPSPFHAAMQQALFGTYNSFFLLIGTLIFVMHIIHVVFETTQTGTAFGKRFNSFWGPFRLLIGIGLLLPINYGMNSGQYIILYVAKYASGFATNAWIAMIDQSGIPIGGVQTAPGDYRNIITAPPLPDVNGLVGFIHMVEVCRHYYENVEKNNTTPVKNIQVFQLHGNNATLMPAYGTAVMNSQGGPINLVIGERIVSAGTGAVQQNKYTGDVVPLCGEITLDVNNANIPGADMAYDGHYNMLQVLLNHPTIITFGEHVVDLETSKAGAGTGVNYPNIGGPHDDIPPTYSSFFYNPGSFVYTLAQATVDAAVADLGAAAELEYTVTQRNRGWAGAGMWYSQVSDLNGTMAEAVGNVPTSTKYPIAISCLMEAKKQGNYMLSTEAMFDLKNADGSEVETECITDYEKPLLKALHKAYLVMLGPDSGVSQNGIGGGNAMSIIEATLNMIFGTSGLSSMTTNSNTHAMFQLTAIGKGLIETSIRNILTSTISSAAGGFLSQMDDPKMKALGKGASAIATLSSTIGQITLTAGIILFYIVPLMPFMYFFFACGRWVKAVFEALVGAPLWALSHLRYEGEGMAESAQSGYYMIFEIFLRPILTVFGLIAALSIFGAMVTVLNDVWSLVTTNLSGYDFDIPAEDVDAMRGRIDQLFFTIFYVVVIYLMAQSSFKLIDLIPNSILRWFGSSTTSFGDMSQDPLDNLTNTAAISGAQMVPQVTGAASKAAGGLGTLGGKIATGK